jgi:O-antigen ligase
MTFASQKDREASYPWHNTPFLYFGLIALIWFAAVSRGGYDQWALTLICAWLSLLVWAFLWNACRNQKKLILPLATPVFFLLFVFLLGSRYSLDGQTTRLELLTCFCVCASFFLFSNLFRQKGSRLAVIQAGGAAVLLVTFIAMTQYVAHVSGSGSPLHESTVHFPFSHWTAQSTFTNSAVLAGFSLSWILLAWHHRRLGPSYLCIFGASLICLCLARSWWAFVSLFAGFIYYYKDSSKDTGNKAGYTVRFFGVLLILLVALMFIYKFGPIRDPAYQTSDRWRWWLAGMRMFLQHPWAGVGLGSYGAAFPYFEPSHHLHTLLAHSLPVQLLSETGLSGTLAVSGLILALATRLIKENDISRECIAYRATGVTLITYSLVTIYMDYFIGKLMLAMATALMISAMNWRPLSVSRRTLIWATTLLLLLIPNWYLPFRASQYQSSGLLNEQCGDWTAAESDFRKALSLDPGHDDSRRGLSRIYQHQYGQTHSMLDLSSALFWEPSPASHGSATMVTHETPR